MKRNMKRLNLSRETLRYLNAEEVSAAQGGASGLICPISTDCPRPIYTHTCFVNCHSASCPTECNQTYC
jgi:hypothetical protein